MGRGATRLAGWLAGALPEREDRVTGAVGFRQTLPPSSCPLSFILPSTLPEGLLCAPTTEGSGRNRQVHCSLEPTSSKSHRGSVGHEGSRTGSCGALRDPGPCHPGCRVVHIELRQERHGRACSGPGGRTARRSGSWGHTKTRTGNTSALSCLPAGKTGCPENNKVLGMCPAHSRPSGRPAVVPEC